MKNLFETTMNACIGSRKKSKISESYDIKPLTEEDEKDLSLDEIPEVLPDNIDGDPEQGEMGDIADDVMVVVDPELDADEVEGAAAEAQKIVDDTPEGEVPSNDKYIGDKTYTCPRCGNTFFSETEMKAGDTCPVCGDTPTDFVLAGEVAEADGADEAGDEPTPEDTPAEDAPKDDAPADDAGDEDVPEEDDEELECFDRKPVASAKRIGNNPAVRNRSVENRKPVVRRGFKIDETTFNPYMGKFIRENYKNARSFKIVGASLNKKRVLTMECVITFKSGKSKNVKLTTEGFRPFNGKRAYIDFREDGAFKTESKSKIAPFIFVTSMRDNVIKCEGMKYNFISNLSEGKKAHVYGKVVTESRNFHKGDRK